MLWSTKMVAFMKAYGSMISEMGKASSSMRMETPTKEISIEANHMVRASIAGLVRRPMRESGTRG